jgi:sporulation protein YlmC with PRC-barrel domain
MKKLLVSMILPALVIVPLVTSAQTSTTPGTRDGKSSDPSRGATSKDAGPAWKNDQNLVEARDIIGTRIKSDLDKDLGSVDNLLIDPKTGKVSQVVVGVGGVLGVGEKKVVVPWDDLKLALTTDSKKPVAKMSEAKLEAAPRYERSASAERDRSSSSPSASPGTTQSGTPKQ